jgi:hypothetical protein
MSYASILEIGTYGQLGEQRTSLAFAPVALDNNFYTIVSNNVNLNYGAWLLTTNITLTPNGDNTSVISRLQMTNNQVVFNTAKYTQNLIFNDSGSVAYTAPSTIFTTQAIIIISNADRGAYNAQLYWLGGGTPPTATATITATKLI